MTEADEPGAQFLDSCVRITGGRFVQNYPKTGEVAWDGEAPGT